MLEQFALLEFDLHKSIIYIADWLANVEETPTEQENDSLNYLVVEDCQDLGLSFVVLT